MSLTISETDARAITACPSFCPSTAGHPYELQDDGAVTRFHSLELLPADAPMYMALVQEETRRASDGDGAVERTMPAIALQIDERVTDPRVLRQFADGLRLAADRLVFETARLGYPVPLTDTLSICVPDAEAGTVVITGAGGRRQEFADFDAFDAVWRLARGSAGLSISTLHADADR